MYRPRQRRRCVSTIHQDVRTSYAATSLLPAADTVPVLEEATEMVAVLATVADEAADTPHATATATETATVMVVATVADPGADTDTAKGQAGETETATAPPGISL